MTSLYERYLIAGLLGVFALQVSGCSTSFRKISARGQLGDYTIETTVDDESAKYYLENYLAQKNLKPNLHSRIQALHNDIDKKLPDRNYLKVVSKDFSVDFGALFFGSQLLKQMGNADLQKEFLRNLELVRSKRATFPKSDIQILMVPGYDYVENGSKTGADFAKPIQLIREAGFDVRLVGIDPLGSVEENADYLAKELGKFRHKKVVLVGASSAGPAIHLAIGKLVEPKNLENVKAWLNLGGILQGVPLLDEFSSGPKGWLFSTVLWFKGWKRYQFESMMVGVSRARYATLSVPKHIKVFNYVGLSLSGDISDFARDKYSMMRDDGPNDGLTLLPDIVLPNSYSILAPKSDHFFAEDPEIDEKTLTLLLTVLPKIQQP